MAATHEGTAPLHDAVKRARIELHTAMEEIRGWLSIPGETRGGTFSVDELVLIGLAMVKRLHRDFAPVVTIVASGAPLMSGLLHLFSDIMFVLFENIQKHSGLLCPQVSVVASTIDPQTLRIAINSEVAAPERHLEPVNSARLKVASGDYLASIPREGGSGLSKLAKLLSNGRAAPKLHFELSLEAREFSVEFELAVHPIHES